MARGAHGLRIEPDGERFREVFVGMALRVPVIQMVDEALAVRLWRVVLGIGGRWHAEQTPSRRPSPEPIGVVDRVAGLMPEDAQARLRIAPFHFEHLRELELRQPW